VQADVALMPFFERFRLCLQLTQDYDLSALQGGSVAAWLVGLHTEPDSERLLCTPVGSSPAGLCCLQDSMSQLPASKLASPDAGLFAAAIKQHHSLDFFDFDTYTAAQCHPQLRPYLCD
jgi:hypothetical protein